MTRWMSVVLSIGAVLFLGCHSAGVVCYRGLEVKELSVDIQDAAEFKVALASALDAQCSCTFAEESRALFPLGVDGRESWDGVQDACLRRFDVLSVSPGSDEFVSIYLAGRWNRRRHGRPVYVMVAHYVAGSWVFSWPAETGDTADRRHDARASKP